MIITNIEEKIENSCIGDLFGVNKPVCKRRVTLELSLEEARKFANQAAFAQKIEQSLNDTSCSLKGTSIQTVQINEGKKIVVVVFDDGRKQIVKCSPEDSFDTEIGFALAFTRALFGSKTQVRKFISKKASVVKKTEKKKKTKKPTGGK